jgi:hypothetical protein
MNNTEDILKRILLNMKYDSRKTLSENYEISLLEDDNKRDTKEYWDNLYRKGKIDKKTYDYHIERIEDLELSKSLTKGIKSINSEPTKEYFTESFITYKTVVPGKTLTVPDTRFGKQSGIQSKSNILQPLVWHEKNKPYDETNANRVFSKTCENTGYFIDDQGNQCKHLDKNGNYKIQGNYTLTKYSDVLAGYPMQIMIKKDQPIIIDKTGKYISFNVFYEDENGVELPLPYPATFNCSQYVTLNNQKYGHTQSDIQFGKDYFIKTLKQKFCENNKVINFSNTMLKQGTFDTKCKVLEKDVCVRWSWESMQTYGAIDKGLKKFKLFESHEKAKDNDGTTYSACVGIPKDSEEKYPWFTQYVGFYDESKFVKSSDPNVAWACPSNAITTLPTIPTFSYGNDKYNLSISDQEKKDEYLKDFDTKINTKDEQQDLQKNKTIAAVSAGIRIKGK